MKTLLITGGTGFIGKNLISYLKRSELYKGFNIITLSSAPCGDFININHKQYSFSKEDFYLCGVNRVDIVLHLGAYTPKSSANENINNILLSTSNINNTMHLLSNLPCKPEKFIFASTLDVYQFQEKLDEKVLPNPQSLYGYSKLYCEKLLEEWADANDVILQILRFGHIYGPGEEAYRKLMPVAIENVLKNKNPVLYTSGNETRQFLYIDDVCNLIMNSIKLDKYIEPVNIVSSRLTTLKEVVKLILEISGSKLDIEYIDKSCIGQGYSFVNSKMLSFLGEEQITLEDGLKKEIEYLRNKYEK